MSRKVFKYSAVIASLLATALFAGCGTSNKEGSDPSAVADVPKVSESACAQCHGASVDHVTGDNIYKDYIASSHFTNNFRLVGCQDCHGGGSQHNGVGPLPYPDPSAAGKCFDCHKPAFLGNYEATKVATAVEKAHFYNMTASQLDPDNFAPAMYVSANYQKSCTSCHDPHKGNNGVGQEHKDWAESGHGKVDSPAWADEDFKENTSCIRCHTSTGFIDYVSSGYTLPTTTWAKAGDTTREVITCKACHTDYNFKNRVRNAGAFTAPYNSGKNPKAFPNVGASNLCNACHAGRESGDTVKGLTSFTNTSFKNSHYLAASGVFYGQAGFQYYTSNVKYDTGYNTGKKDTATTFAATWNHGKIGVNNFNNSGYSGQCVGCHFGNGGVYANYSSHTLSAVNVAHSTGATGCFGCHSSEDISTLVEEEKALFDRGMDFFNFTLAQNNIFYTTNYPYFMTSAGGTTAIKNWTYAATVPVGPATGNGANNMGAAFNYNLLLKEKGAHVHNRSYARRLIFDSIQYLQKGAVTYSISTGSIGGVTDPNSQVSFTAYSTAQPTGTISITGLKGWLLRSSGGKYYRR